VLVEAAGLPLDGLYQYRALPGRYAIQYGRARTATPVFWKPEDVRVIPPADQPDSIGER
jgi:hypothetical protein